GVEEAVLVENLAALVLEIALDNAEALHFQPAEALAVPGQLLVLVVDDLHFDAERRPALLGLNGELLIVRKSNHARLDRPGRADRAHFRHPPGVADRDAVIVLESPDHVRRAGRAADADELERGQPLILLAHILHEAE